jgi:hypothetical protein
MSDLKPDMELTPSVHPAVRNFGPDTSYDFDIDPAFRWLYETGAEREGLSVDAMKEAIIRNADSDDGVGMAEWRRARDEVIPLSRTCDDD